jgi:hypothetical protein
MDEELDQIEKNDTWELDPGSKAKEQECDWYKVGFHKQIE